MRTGTVSSPRAAENDDDVVVGRLVLVVLRSRPGRELRGTIGSVAIVVPSEGGMNDGRAVVALGGSVEVVMELVVVLCGATVITGRRGAGAAAVVAVARRTRSGARPPELGS